MAKRLAPWWRNRQWCVEANTNTGARGTREGWKPIYCTAKKVTARANAKQWKSETGQDVRVVPGEGHRSRR